MIEVLEEPLHVRLRPDHQGGLHKLVLDRLVKRRKASREHVEQRFDDWNRADRHLRLYIDPSEKARLSGKREDTSKLENPFPRAIAMPINYVTTMTRLSQLLATLNARDPKVHIEGRESSDFRPARLVEAAIRYDLQQMRSLLVDFSACLDGERYGLSIVHDTWAERWGWVRPGNRPRADQLRGLPASIAAAMMNPPREWQLITEHNRFETVDPFLFRPDPDASLGRPETWTYVGHERFESWIDLWGDRLEAGGPYCNLEKVKKLFGGAAGRSDEGEEDTGRQSEGTFTEGAASDEEDITGRTRVFHGQIKLIPRAWKLGDSDRPELWSFSVAGDQVVIRFHRDVYDHGEYRYRVAQLHPDPHAPWTPGSSELLDGVQRFGNWLINSHIYNAFRALYNQVIAAPNLINMSDLRNPGPGWLVRLTGAGEDALEAGTPIGSMYSQLQIQDVTRGHVTDYGLLSSEAQRITAAGDTAQGMPLPDRRTLGEVQQMFAAGSSRVTMHAQLKGEQQDTPLAYAMIANRQQFTTLQRAYRLVGDAAKVEGAERVWAGPSDFAGGFDYVPHVASSPPDPARAAEVWMKLGEMLARSPNLLQPDDQGRRIDFFAVFGEIARSMGVKYLDQFIRQTPQPGAMPFNAQVMPDEQLDRQVQAGNLVPMGMVQ